MTVDALLVFDSAQGRLAQLEERHVHTVEVMGSRPVSPTSAIGTPVRMPVAVTCEPMTRRCERPGCSEPASVSFRFDARRRLVELFPGVTELENLAGALCRRHGDAMVLPRGWVLDDQRVAVPRLFDVAGAPSRPEVTPKTRRRRRDTSATHSASDPSVNLFVVPEVPEVVGEAVGEAVGEITVADVAGEHPDAAADETRAIPWAPVFDPADNLGGMLDATTPMLRRAFGTDHRRRSR